jgi:hypothetical protein
MRRGKKSDVGMRRHRPKKRLRFEYIKGKYSHFTREEREGRRLDKLEEDEIRAERFEAYLESHLKRGEQGA